MDFKAMTRDMVAKARASGVRLPVVMVLSQDSSHARAVYQDLHGEPMGEHHRPDGEEYGPLELMPSMAAVDLLRRHASKGGACAAAQIEDEALPVDWWFVCMGATQLLYNAFGDDLRHLFHARVSYDNPPRDALKPIGERLQEEGPVMMNLGTGGEVARVFGRDGVSAAIAGALVSAVSSRRMIIPHKGQNVEVPLDDDRLSSFLLNVYGEEPHVVAEAMTTLMKMKGDKSRWLRSLLWGRPELRPLANAVQRELTGEDNSP